MADSKNITNSAGFCRKMCNAFNTTFLCISHSIATHKKPRTSPAETGPARVLHQPTPSKTIPVELDPSAGREVVILSSQKLPRLPNNYREDGLPHDNKFSDYIKKVKDRLMKTGSSVGGNAEAPIVQDSFNDKATSYINRTKVKVRKTTSLGSNKGYSIE